MAFASKTAHWSRRRCSSNRYITARFLPDKAIDLIDEAASRLRIEIDSMPTEIDVVERRMRQLEIEHVALAKEDRCRVDRAARSLDRELADLREQSDGYEGALGAGKGLRSRSIRALKEEFETARARRSSASSDLEKAAEIRYGRIPELERQLPTQRKCSTSCKPTVSAC